MIPTDEESPITWQCDRIMGLSASAARIEIENLIKLSRTQNYEIDRLKTHIKTAIKHTKEPIYQKILEDALSEEDKRGLHD